MTATSETVRARVNCYVPKPLKDRYLEVFGDSGDPSHSFSQILQRGIIATLAEAEASSS